MKKVLIVDDNGKNLDLFKDFVESWGYETITAQQGRDAIELAARHLPDVILLDVMLPGMSGYEVCRELKEAVSTQDIPVVMITVLNDIADRLHGYKIGADHFLVKPVDYNELHAILDNLLQKKSQLDTTENRLAVLESLSVLLKQVLLPEHIVTSNRKYHYCQKLCTYFNLSKTELEQGYLFVRVQDIIASLCRYKNSGAEAEMKFLDSLQMNSWLRPLLQYVREYNNGIDIELQESIKNKHLEKLAEISFVLERYGAILAGVGYDDSKALATLRQEAVQYAYPQDVVQIFEQIINDELFMSDLKNK